MEHMKTQNWFAVLLDFVIVVLGVAVAMYGQQWLSDRQQRTEMAGAEAAIQLELYDNYFNAKHRVALAKCRAETYQAIAEKLMAGEETWTGIPRAADKDGGFGGALPVVLRSPQRIWPSGIWKAELGKGTFSQMSDERRNVLVAIYKQVEIADQLQTETFALQGRLKALAINTKISQSDRLRYYDTLAELDDKSAYFEIIASDMVAGIEYVGLKIPQKKITELTKQVTDFNQFIKSIYGECYEPQAWPILDTKPKKAKTP
jgi:hypothetical protein